MIKGDSKSDRVLRSASPHRNAYQSDFHSIKYSFEGSSVLHPSRGSETRDRPSGSRVNEIKSIFLQMEGQQPQDGLMLTKSGQTKFQRGSTSHRSSMSSTSSMESPTSEMVRKVENVSFDKVALAEKFSVTRKLFESGLKDPSDPGRSTPVRIRSTVQSVSEESKCGKSLSDQSQKAKEDKHGLSTGGETALHISGLFRNAGPISRRLESFMLDSDSESLSGPSTSAHSQSPCSPTSDHSDPSLSPDCAGSPTSYSLWPESPSNRVDASGKSIFVAKEYNPQFSISPADEVCIESSPQWSSPHTYSVDNYDTSVSVVATEPVILFKSEKRHRLSQGSGSVSSPENDIRSLERLVSKVNQSKEEPTVRAELVDAKNESSESESNEEDHAMDDVFEEFKSEQAVQSHLSTEGLFESHKVHRGKSKREFLMGSEERDVEEESLAETCCKYEDDKEAEKNVNCSKESKSGRDLKLREEEVTKGTVPTMDLDSGNKDRANLLEEFCLNEEALKEEWKKDVEEKDEQLQQKEPSQRLKMKDDELKGMEGKSERILKDRWITKVETEKDVDDALEFEDEYQDVEELSEEEQQQQVDPDKMSSVCGIENAAFLDDRDSTSDSEAEQDEFQKYDELPGLSDEDKDEDSNLKRKIRFSTAPIKVK